MRLWRPSRWSGLMVAGCILCGTGTILALAAATPTEAAALGVCGTNISLVPGASGSCTETISDTANSTATQVNVTLQIKTTSVSGGGAVGSGVATEAVLDGQPDGLQVKVSDASNTYDLGPVQCYTDSTLATSASYPDAGYCTGTSSFQTVATNVPNASFSDTLTIQWSFPLAASNPYQGSAAQVSIQSTYTGTTAGGQLGASTTGGGTGSGTLGASTPTTGAQLPVALARWLIVLGILLALLGALLFVRAGRRQRA